MQAKEEVVEQKLAERRSLISQNIQNFKKKNYSNFKWWLSRNSKLVF